MVWYYLYPKDTQSLPSTFFNQLVLSLVFLSF